MVDVVPPVLVAVELAVELVVADVCDAPAPDLKILAMASSITLFGSDEPFCCAD